MYQLGGTFSDIELDPGTNLLIEGPPMTGKYGLALEHLAAGNERGEGTIIVSTKDGAERVEEEFSRYVDAAGGPLGIVDCVTKQQGTQRLEDEHIRYVSSPVDMTGIGIELSELLRQFYQGLGVTENRILLHSLSTLLMYSNLQTVFRFLHVFTGRVQSADAFGIYVIDNTAHDTKTVSTLKQLFDGIVEVRETDDGNEARLVGMDEAREWRRL